MGAFRIAAPALADFDECRWHEDPFGAGVRLQIERSDTPRQEEFTEQVWRTNPLLKRLAYVLATERHEDDSPLSPLEARRRAYQQLVTEGHPPGDLDLGDTLGQALSLLRGWEGLARVDDAGNAEPVPYSLEAARELLTCSTTVVRSGEFRGMDLGPALATWIVFTARAHATERQELLEVLEGNSAPSSESGAE